MTKQEAIDGLRNMSANSDSEFAHGEAEKILCDFLRDIGHAEIANEFEAARDRVEFWYA